MRRLTLVLAATVAVCIAEYWLPALVGGVVGSRTAERSVRVLLAASIVILLFTAAAFRLWFSLRSNWSWAGIIPLAYVAQNLATIFASDEVNIPATLALIVIADGAAVGVLEEFFFRGLAFLKGAGGTPRATVLMTAAAFALAHFADLTVGSTVPRVLSVAFFALPIGIIFGVIRLATGSIFWPVILHAMVTASGYFGVVAGVPEIAGSVGFDVAVLLLSSITFGAAVILVVRHPAMKRAAI